MKKSLKSKVSGIYLSNFSVNSAILLLFLLLGTVIGMILTKQTGEGSALSSFENDINEIVQNGVGEYSLIKTFFNATKFPLAIFLLGFTVFGVFFAPLVVCVKGCLLSMSVSAIINSFGAKGFILALSMFGIQALAAIPCIIILSSYSMEVSKGFLSAFNKFKKNSLKTRPQTSSFVILFFVVVFILFLFSLLDVTVTPKLVSLSAKTIF